MFPVCGQRTTRELSVRQVYNCLNFNQFWSTVEHRRERPRILGRDAAGELDRRVGRKRILELGIELPQILMRQHHAHIELPGLGENDSDIAVEIVLRLIDIDECRRPLLLGQGRAFLCRLGDERDKEPTEDLRTLLFEQILGGIDQNDLARVQLREQVEFGTRMGEHALEGLIFEDAP